MHMDTSEHLVAGSVGKRDLLYMHFFASWVTYDYVLH